VDWRIVIIPLIPLAVWIIASIFRSLDEGKEKERGRRPGDRSTDESAPPRPPRRPASEMDRFMQEARQRRTVSRARQSQAAPESAPKPPVVKPLREEPPLEAIPVEVPRPAPRAPEPPRPVEQPRPVERPQPTAVPVAKLVPAERPSTPAPPPPPPPPTVVLPAAPLSPVAARVRALLRDQVALQSAFVLHEVLGRPKCRRRQ
jgi:hypothetical protein